MDVRNNCAGARNIVLKLRDDCLGVCNALMNVRNDHICVYRKLGLKTND